MENDNANKTPNFEKRITGIIRILMTANKSSLNRQLAVEAMMDAMLARVPQNLFTISAVAEPEMQGG